MYQIVCIRYVLTWHKWHMSSVFKSRTKIFTPLFFSSSKKAPGSRPSWLSPWQPWPRPRRSMRRHSGPVRRPWRRTTRQTLTSTSPGRMWRNRGWTPTSRGSRWTTARTSTPTSCRKPTSFRWESGGGATINIKIVICPPTASLRLPCCDQRQIGDTTPLVISPRAHYLLTDAARIYHLLYLQIVRLQS